MSRKASVPDLGKPQTLDRLPPLCWKEPSGYVNLIQADYWGNYWLTSKPMGRAIFRAADPRRGWFVSRGGERGVLFAGEHIRYFATPEAALAALEG